MINGYVPKAHKEGVAAPIFKSGDRTRETNYRLVQMNSVFQKIHDKSVGNKIYEYLEDYSLLDEHQHGFRKGHSCDTNLLDSWNYIVDQNEKGEGSTLAMVDYSKAFDKVPHHLLTQSIAKLGIGGNVGRWLNSWLTGRTQQVKVDGQLSGKILITSGTIQGSNLGPLLYSIFVNDMTKDLSNPYSLYADDLKIYGSTRTIEDCQKLQNDMDTLSNWAELNGMKINTDKSVLLPLGKNQNQNLPFRLAGGVLPWVNEAKDLGVTLTKNLRFSRHVTNRARKCYQIIGQIKRTIKTRKPETLKKLWNTLILPTVTFACPVWYQETPGINQELQKIYKRFWKMLPGHNLDILSPVEEVKRLNLLSAKRILSGSTALKPEKYFEFSSRSSQNGYNFLQKRKTKTMPGGENFFNRIITSWNRLKKDEKISSYMKFKNIARESVLKETRSATLLNTNAAIWARLPSVSVFRQNRFS